MLSHTTSDFPPLDPIARRQFLATAAAIAAAPLGPAPAQPKKRPRVAAIYTIFRHRSHAHDILENFLASYYFRGRLTDSGMEVVSFYADQTAPEGEMSLDVARQFNVDIYPTIESALCRGGKELAVDAVLSIGEHGEYPLNNLGQREYPRKRFFDAIVGVMRRSGRFVPLFNDKHLAYRWDWAKEMYDTTKRLGIPFLAGSSVPLAQRIPALELPASAEITEAIAIHGGGLESYDFHGLEILESLVEARRGGETGIARVELLQGKELWKAADQGRFSLDLANAALAAEQGPKLVLQRDGGPDGAAAHAILLKYKDGLRGTVLKVGKSSTRWTFACRLKGDPQPHACRFYTGPWGNRNLFKALSHAIQHLFRTGAPPYPVERTLLTTGAVEAAMRSRAAGKPLANPHLELAYAAKDFRAFRENGESWKIITEETRELRGINPNGAKP